MGSATDTAEAKVMIFMDVDGAASFLLLVEMAGVARDQTGTDKGGGGGMGEGLLLEPEANSLVDEQEGRRIQQVSRVAQSCGIRNMVLVWGLSLLAGHTERRSVVGSRQLQIEDSQLTYVKPTRSALKVSDTLKAVICTCQPTSKRGSKWDFIPEYFVMSNLDLNLVSRLSVPARRFLYIYTHTAEFNILNHTVRLTLTPIVECSSHRNTDKILLGRLSLTRRFVPTNDNAKQDDRIKEQSPS